MEKMETNEDEEILTEEMVDALQAIDSGQNVFITGQAGTGKTKFLRKLKAEVLNSRKAVIAAPTGLAALNCDGMTLHSLFGLPFGPMVADDEDDVFKQTHCVRSKLIKAIDIMVIDEISMVRADMIDCIDIVLRHMRSDHRPFGGVQIVMFGDLYQLPPVIKSEDAEILEKYYPGKELYFFDANVWKKSEFKTVCFSVVFRQRDLDFIEILNKVRDYTCTQNDLDFLNLKCVGDPSQGSEISDCTHLCSIKTEADGINQAGLTQAQYFDTKDNVLRDGIVNKKYVSEAEVKGKFSVATAPVDQRFEFCVGSRVIFTVNSPSHDYVNGTIGHIVYIDEDPQGEVEKIVVYTEDKNYVNVYRHTWNNVSYELKFGKVQSKILGSMSQFPLRLAWAITIHKSQGLTLDKVNIHLGNIFTSGQLYVALSRCRGLQNLTLDRPIKMENVMHDEYLKSFFSLLEKQESIYNGELICV